jgi:hypothetical protein
LSIQFAFLDEQSSQGDGKAKVALFPEPRE